MKKKNILFVFTITVGFNGINIATLELLKRMDKEKYCFYVLSSVESVKEVEDMFVNDGCIFLKEEYRNSHPFKYLRNLRKIIREKHIDIVHAMGNSATLAVEMYAAKKEKVCLRIAHSRNTYCEHTFIDKLLRPFLYRFCNCRLACGTEAGKWLFKKRDFVVLKNGKAFEKYAFSSRSRLFYRKQFGCSDKTCLIGHVGLFNEQKNHVFIIELAKVLSSLSFDNKIVLVGDGPKKNDIQEMVRSYGLEDKIVFVNQSFCVNDMLSAFDVMILPSLYEGLPNVVIEWQINGLPCIVSERVTRECAINENIVFLPISSANLWADSLVNGKPHRLQSEDIIKKNLRENGFDLDLNAKKLDEIYAK